MPDKPMRLISVIMPCYNGATYVANSVASVLNQTHRELELIIIDDGSTDNSLEVITAIDDTRIHFIKQNNRGVCAARNRGLKAAQGDYIAFLDSDDTWHPACLETLYNALQVSPTAALAYCGWQNTGTPARSAEPFIPPDYEGSGKLAALLQRCRWPIHAALTRREAIEKAGAFDERFHTSEDFYLWLRIGSCSKVVRVPKVLAYYHHHTGPQATKNAARQASNHWLVQREFLRNNPEVIPQLGRKRVRELTDGELLRQGYVHYWQRQLKPARKIFRLVMKTGYGNFRDWKYMLPSLLPLPLHHFLLKVISNN